MKTVGDVLGESAARLAEVGVESPSVDAELLLAHVLGTTRSALRADPRRELGSEARAELDTLLARRAAREPLAYVLGEWGFRQLTLRVDPRVLVPRPETEVVVERCLALIAGLRAPRVLDVGTGSGAIALAIADEHPGALVTGMDVSGEALEVAHENATRTGLAVELLEGDFFGGLPAGPWDLLVSNPPYVLPDDVDSLEPEVRDWEPRACARQCRGYRGDRAAGRLRPPARGSARPRGCGGRRRASRGAPARSRLRGDRDHEGSDRAGSRRRGRDDFGHGGTGRCPRRVRSPRVSSTAEAVAAIRAGDLVVLPTDTVYGLVCTPNGDAPVRALSALKGRSPEQPLALLAASIDRLVDAVPELRGKSERTARALLPGPYTLVFPNPARRFARLTGERPETIGVRVPALAGPGAVVLDRVGLVAATSANVHGGPDPRRIEDVPVSILAAAAVVVDGGELPGTPSTVLDLAGDEPRVLREGAVHAAAALAAVEALAE